MSNLPESDPMYKQLRKVDLNNGPPVYIKSISENYPHGFKQIVDHFNIKFPIIIKKVGNRIIKNLGTLANALLNVKDKCQKSVVLTFDVGGVEVKAKVMLN